MRKEKIYPCFNIVRLACKITCIAIVMSLGSGAMAQTEPRFYMGVDTAYDGIRVGQEVKLKYCCTVAFDSLIPPEFGGEIEVVGGPEPRRVVSAVWVNGEKQQVREEGFTFRVRFLREGLISLPVSSVKIGGKAYHTPSLSVRVKPAAGGIEGVECQLSSGVLLPGKEGMFSVTLTCNRRPDNLSPLLVVGDRKYEPNSRSSGFSSRRDTTGGKPGEMKTQERYDFQYNIEQDGRSTYICSVEGLSFGGVPYPLEDRVVGIAGGASGSRMGLLVVAVLGVILIMGGVWLCFRREAGEDVAGFVLRYKRLNLGTEGALTHYGFPLFLGSMPLFFLLFDGYGYMVEGWQHGIFHWFWCGVLPLVLAVVFWRNQRLKLNFRAVPTVLSAETLLEVVEEVARENNWTVDYAGTDYIAAHTNPRGWRARWGEQIFVVFDRGQVWINSLSDLNKRTTVCSFGYPKKNIRILQDAIGKREK